MREIDQMIREETKMTNLNENMKAFELNEMEMNMVNGGNGGFKI